MIDVVLLLIIFFLVTAQFSRSIRVPIELPEQPGSDRREVDESGALIVDLLADGSLRLEGEVVTIEVFRSMMTSAVRSSDRAIEVLIRPDRSARAAELNRLASLMADAGVGSYRIATTPGAEASR